ncbi:hypothetical protein QNM99_09710 [Pseudomonas sp. PCH446]
MTYRAVPMAVLLQGIQADDHLQAVALDGFAAEMAAAPLLNRQGAQAWLAVEDPGKPWPPLADGKPSAGPFYLVWTDPQAGHVSPEQCPTRWPVLNAWPRWPNASRPCVLTPSWRPVIR